MLSLHHCQINVILMTVRKLMWEKERSFWMDDGLGEGFGDMRWSSMVMVRTSGKSNGPCDPPRVLAAAFVLERFFLCVWSCQASRGSVTAPAWTTCRVSSPCQSLWVKYCAFAPPRTAVEQKTSW